MRENFHTAKISTFTVTQMFKKNSFLHFLYRLPTPRPGEVLGLVGTNGIGKSTALKILAGKLKPNLGKFDVRIDVISTISFLVEENDTVHLCWSRYRNYINIYIYIYI